MPQVKGFKITVLYCFVSVLLLLPLSGHSGEKIVLQLKWEHEFQFAGYYAAMWQGFYERAGLDVEIRSSVKPDRTVLDPQIELLSGRADFAIGGLDILSGRDNDLPLVVLAPIFQRSPCAIILLKDTPASSLADLAKLKIAAPQGDYVTTEVKALFQKEGINPEDVNFLYMPPTINTLVSGQADAIVTYGISGQYAASELGVEVKVLHPSDYGISFYGDTLYTHQRVIDKDPELVQRFLKASIDGWVYALEHREEVARRIGNELPRHAFSYRDFVKYNLEFSRVIDDYLLFPVVQIGNNNIYRWEKMNEMLVDLGVVKSGVDIKSLFFNVNQVEEENFIKASAFIALIVFVLTILMLSQSKKQIYLVPILLFSLIIVTTVLVEKYRKEQLKTEHTFNTLQQLVSIREKLSGSLNKTLSLVSSFATHISLNPSITAEQFQVYAREMIKQDPLLINFAAAPDLVNKFIYPLEGNEKALGLEYAKNKSQNEVVFQVVNTGKPMVAGPVRLVQGGSAFIARAPVFVGDEKSLWGIISAPIDALGLYERVGLTDANLNIDIAIKGRDALGEDGDLFFGNERIFNKDPVTLDLQLNNGSWHLAAIPKDGWGQVENSIWAIRIFGAMMAALAAFFAVYRSRQISARELVIKELHRSESMLKHTGSMASIGGWEFDAVTNTIYFSDESYRIFGVENINHLKDLNDILNYFPQQVSSLFHQLIEEVLINGEASEIESSYTNEDGNIIWFGVVAEPELSNDKVDLIRGVVKDISANKKTENIIRYQAEYDSLTKLPNRSLFDDRLSQAVQKGLRNSEKFALLFIDLDDFKTINDTLGHAAGDLLLQQLAKRLVDQVRACDTVARLSGDEFIILLENISKEKTIDSIINQILNSLTESFTIKNNEVYSSASIGVTIFPDDGDNPRDLLKNADQAMYAAKASGRNNYHYFTAEMQLESDRRHRVYNDLIKAIALNEFRVLYQPIIDLNSGSIVKCEALVRWVHPEHGVIAPNEFIPIAESTGLINDIDGFVMRTAAADLHALSKECGKKIDVAINKSTNAFHLKKKTDTSWLDEIKLFDHAPHITIEITESLLIEDDSHVMEQLHELKQAGFSISIDDFGTGYSSLSYLKRFPVDVLKIDRAFISDVASNEESRALVIAILAMAKGLNLKVVAEGVETEDQKNTLVNYGCDFAQGYLFSEALAFEDFKALLIDNIDTIANR